jgi:hypothetical protein
MTMTPYQRKILLANLRHIGEAIEHIRHVLAKLQSAG